MVSKRKEFHGNLKISTCIYRGYSMVWHWIWNLFLERDRIFYISREQSTSEHMKKSCLSREINSIFNDKSIEFFVFFILFEFQTCFFQIIDTACNTQRDVTIAYYYHTVKISFWCFHNVKITACKDIPFIQWIKPDTIWWLKM